MKIIKASAHLVSPRTLKEGIQQLKIIEREARRCYKSEEKITKDSYVYLLADLLSRKPRPHLSVFEHGIARVAITTDRGVSHELVRHRLMSPSQESTRYCNYSKGKFGNSITVIDLKDHLKTEEQLCIWLTAMTCADNAYQDLIALGCSPQIARSVLPNSLKTELGITANFVEWRHIFQLRTDKAAHPQMREVMIPLLYEFQKKIPIVFSDITVEE